MSSKASFKDKLNSCVKELNEFHVLLKSADNDKHNVMFPNRFSHIPIANILQQSKDSC